MDKEKTTVVKRRTYCKPQIERVQLVLEEAVLTGCKRGNAAGPFANNCAPGQGCPTNKGS
jgi:hypothetical protein